MERGRGLTVATAVAAAWLAPTPAGCKKAPTADQEDPRESVAAQVADDLGDRLGQAAKADMADGSDDFGIPGLSPKNRAFLARLEKEDPKGYQTFIFRLKEILKARKRDLEDDDDVQHVYANLEIDNNLLKRDSTT